MADLRCPDCNKLLMRDGEIKCSRCKGIVTVGEPCEHYEGCSHKSEETSLNSIVNLLNMIPVSKQYGMRLSKVMTSKTAD